MSIFPFTTHIEAAAGQFWAMFCGVLDVWVATSGHSETQEGQLIVDSQVP